MIYIPEIIGETIDTIRDRGGYSDGSQNGANWTVTAIHDLKVGYWVVIINEVYDRFSDQFPITFSDDLETLISDDADATGEFKVVSITSTTFTIEAATIPVTGTYKSINPYYIFGHRVEIGNRLLEKEQDSKSKLQKYPLIALRLDILENISGNVSDVELSLAIMEYTDENYYTKDRYDNIIIPILDPIYADFISALSDHNDISTVGPIDHTRIDRPFWGTEGPTGNEENIFSDPLDAIEIQNLNFQIINNICNGNM